MRVLLGWLLRRLRTRGVWQALARKGGVVTMIVATPSLTVRNWKRKENVPMTLVEIVHQLVSMIATLAVWVAAVRRTHPFAIIFALISTGSTMASLVIVG